MTLKKWGFPVFILAVELLLCSLGTWQIFRGKEKRALIQTYTLKSESPPIDLKNIPDNASSVFQRILVKGHFLQAHEKILQPRTFEGKSGVHIVTPFELEDGRTILVDRGWTNVQNLPSSFRPQETIELQGILYAVRAPGFFTPPNNPDKNLWYSLNPKQLFPSISFENLYVASLREAGRTAHPRAPLALFRNAHLEYALTWYALAICVLVAYQVLRYQQRKGGRQSPSGVVARRRNRHCEP